MRHFLIFALFGIVGFTPALLLAADLPGSKDHSLLARYPNSTIAEYEKNFNEVEFNVTWQGTETKTPVEGQVTKIRYYHNNADDQPSALQVLRNYQNAVKGIGGEVIYERKPSENDGGETTLKVIEKGKEYWIKVVPEIFSAPSQSYQITILERAAMDQLVKANRLLDELITKGFVTLYINFDTNKWDIKPEAKPIIADAAKILNLSPEYKISVEGHTDNVGDPAANKTLSENRAKSVMRALTYEGIAADRLSVVGFGADRPVADNSTDAGRESNRRVELVKK